MILTIGSEQEQWIMITFPASIPVSWEHPTAAAQGVTGYNVYLDGVLATSTASLSASVTVASAGLHTFEVSAVNQDGESAKSAAVNFIGLPDAPINLVISR